MNEENVPDQELIPSSREKYMKACELKTTPYTEKARPGHALPDGVEVLGFVRDDPYLGRRARPDQQEARQAMSNEKVCTCGGLEIAAGPVYPSVVFAGTRHCWDGRPCYLEPVENVAPDGGELVGYAARTFQRESPFWARSGESIEIGQLSPEESEKAMREAILGEQQPEPTSTDEPSAHDLVIADMAARKELLADAASSGSLSDPVTSAALADPSFAAPGVRLVVEVSLGAVGSGPGTDAVLRFVEGILSGSAPDDILGPNVELDSVEVPGLKTFRPRTVMGQSDEDMKESLSASAGFASEGDPKITVSVEKRGESLARFALSERDDRLIRIDEIAPESRDRKKGIVGHIDSSTVGHAPGGLPSSRELFDDYLTGFDRVSADLLQRRIFGLAKYGSLLQPGNGRDNLQDLYEELLDACVYIRNEIERRNNDVGPLGDKIGRLLEIAEHGHAVYVGEAGPDPEDAAFLRNFRREFGGTAEFEPEP